MIRWLLVLFPLLCCGWGEAILLGGGNTDPTPTPTATPTATPTPTPTATPAGTIYTEDCTSIADWTDVSSANAGWVATGGVCIGEISLATAEPAMTRGVLTSTNEFCSFQVKQINTTAVKLGCIFRYNTGTGAHYSAVFNQKNNNYGLESHTSPHSFNGDVTGTGECSCTYTDLNQDDYVGITLTGTSVGDDTAVSFFDFGATPPSSLTDPSTWGTATCACSAANVNASDLTEIDAVGHCGIEAQVQSDTSTTEPDIDGIACGDTP